MTEFLLMIVLAGATGIQPVYADKLPTMAECQEQLAAQVKQIPRDAQINYVAICAPIRNATAQDA